MGLPVDLPELVVMVGSQQAVKIEAHGSRSRPNHREDHFEPRDGLEHVRLAAVAAVNPLGVVAISKKHLARRPPRRQPQP